MTWHPHSSNPLTLGLGPKSVFKVLLKYQDNWWLGGVELLSLSNMTLYGVMWLYCLAMAILELPVAIVKQINMGHYVRMSQGHYLSATSCWFPHWLHLSEANEEGCKWCLWDTLMSQWRAKCPKQDHVTQETLRQLELLINSSHSAPSQIQVVTQEVVIKWGPSV